MKQILLLIILILAILIIPNVLAACPIEKMCISQQPTTCPPSGTSYIWSCSVSECCFGGDLSCCTSTACSTGSNICVSGEKSCYNPNYIQTCRQDAYGCYTWGSPSLCQYGCENGECNTELTCSDSDGDYSIKENVDPSSCGAVCGPNHNFPCFKTNNDCDDTDNTVWQNLAIYEDLDGDGFGTGSPQTVCIGANLPDGYADLPGDCNDNNNYINPGFLETYRCSDGLDNNCDGLVDLQDPDCEAKGDIINITAPASKQAGETFTVWVNHQNIGTIGDVKLDVIDQDLNVIIESILFYWGPNSPSNLPSTTITMPNNDYVITTSIYHINVADEWILDETMNKTVTLTTAPAIECIDQASSCTGHSQCAENQLCDKTINKCALNCGFFTDETSCPSPDCCKYDLVKGCIAVPGSGALYCNQNTIINTEEECDPTADPMFRDGVTCSSIDPSYISGTLYCTDFCEIDTSQCSTGVICNETTTCADYSEDICENNECGLVDGCYFNDLIPLCESCSFIADCVDYLTETSCTEGHCNPYGVTCGWDSTSGSCYTEMFYTDTVIIGAGEEAQCEWDCSGLKWGDCIDGIRTIINEAGGEASCSLSSGPTDCGTEKTPSVSCRITKEFPFFSTNGIIIVLILLIGYYFFINYNKKKK